jgi:hypothetical protein
MNGEAVITLELELAFVEGEESRFLVTVNSSLLFYVGPGSGFER